MFGSSPLLQCSSCRLQPSTTCSHAQRICEDALRPVSRAQLFRVATPTSAHCIFCRAAFWWPPRLYTGIAAAWPARPAAAGNVCMLNSALPARYCPPALRLSPMSLHQVQHCELFVVQHSGSLVTRSAFSLVISLVSRSTDSVHGSARPAGVVMAALRPVRLCRRPSSGARVIERRTGLKFASVRPFAFAHR